MADGGTGVDVGDGTVVGGIEVGACVGVVGVAVGGTAEGEGVELAYGGVIVVGVNDPGGLVAVGVLPMVDTGVDDGDG